MSGDITINPLVWKALQVSSPPLTTHIFEWSCMDEGECRWWSELWGMGELQDDEGGRVTVWSWRKSSECDIQRLSR